jgi:hypothetical protein
MKKTLLITFTLFALILTACAASGGTAQAGSTNRTNTPLPMAEVLLIGTLKLDGTSNAVTAKQATDLLPLWQVYKDLSASSNAAQEEIDALVQQVQDTLTPEQMQAIIDMKLTRQDVFATMQQLGIVTDRPETGSGTTTPGQGNGGGSRGSGGGFPGGGGGGFPGGGGGQSLTPQQIATAQARRAQGGSFSTAISPALFDAIIQYLQKIAGS